MHKLVRLHNRYNVIRMKDNNRGVRKIQYEIRELAIHTCAYCPVGDDGQVWMLSSEARIS